jgi:putative transcriptional regulator
VLSIEKEKYDPSLELAFKIANLFHVTIEDIFSYQDKTRAGPVS